MKNTILGLFFTVALTPSQTLARDHLLGDGNLSFAERCRKSYLSELNYHCAAASDQVACKNGPQENLKQSQRKLSAGEDKAFSQAHNRCLIVSRRKGGRTINTTVTDLGTKWNVSRDPSDGSTTVIIYARGGGFLECIQKKDAKAFDWCGIGGLAELNPGSYDFLKKRPSIAVMDELRSGRKTLEQAFPLDTRSVGQPAWHADREEGSTDLGSSEAGASK